ncbi:MAG: hypothetical protein V7L11_23785 [Nostoc sp.]|uniref:hypothetical protein n=1 Tax=Nostoc sp. TaxID=1180 RepID=UPI002FF4FB19
MQLYHPRLTASPRRQLCRGLGIGDWGLGIGKEWGLNPYLNFLNPQVFSLMKPLQIRNSEFWVALLKRGIGAFLVFVFYHTQY